MTPTHYLIFVGLTFVFVFAGIVWAFRPMKRPKIGNTPFSSFDRPQSPAYREDDPIICVGGGVDPILSHMINSTFPQRRERADRRRTFRRQQFRRWKDQREPFKPHPKCTHDPNTCRVGFCGFPKCNNPEW